MTDENVNKLLKLCLALVMMIFLGGGMVMAAERPTEVNAQAATNLLVNPSFEGAYVEWQRSIVVAQGWQPFYDKPVQIPPQPADGSTGPWRDPEYKPLTVDIDESRVRSGDTSQCWFAFYAIMDAGIRQSVPVREGAFYQGSVWAQQWSDKGDDPELNRAEMYVSVGIDPYGGESAWQIHVQWSPWVLVRAPRGEFVFVEGPVVQARADQVTVFVRAWHKWAVKHGDAYVDDASLVEVDSPGPQPTPTPEPTPQPTPEPTPTPGPGGNCDYNRIEDIVRRAVEEREPVRWPR